LSISAMLSYKSDMANAPPPVSLQNSRRVGTPASIKPKGCVRLHLLWGSVSSGSARPASVKAWNTFRAFLMHLAESNGWHSAFQLSYRLADRTAVLSFPGRTSLVRAEFHGEESHHDQGRGSP
jgi:hypothetical protein